MQVIGKMYFGSQVFWMGYCTHNLIKDVTGLVDSDKKTPFSLGHIQYKT
jgi:aerobic-type carbon monoxide dehydrogenase small subunit (CoxS/CutS family)